MRNITPLTLKLGAGETALLNGTLLAAAGQDIRLEAGTARTALAEQHQYTAQKTFSTKTTATRDRVEQTLALGTALGGDTATRA